MYSAKPPFTLFWNPYTSCFSHIQYWPDLQNRHSQQGTICSEITRSPSLNFACFSTFSPSSTTCPTNSCPGIMGALIYFGWPFPPQKDSAPTYDLISPAEIPQASTFTIISSAPARGTGTVSKR